MINADFAIQLQGTDGPLLLQISLVVKNKSFVTISGESGAGKTTLLKTLAGLTFPDLGVISIDGNKVFEKAANLYVKPQSRPTAIVFQDLALFPHQTIRDNISFAAGKEEEGFVNQLLKSTGLGNLSNRRPHQLSRGQQQRAAIARAIAQRPKVLLLDEPFSALDKTSKNKLTEFISNIHQEHQLTTVVVTHDPEQFDAISNSHYQLHAGILQAAEPTNVSLFSGVVKNVNPDQKTYTIIMDGAKLKKGDSIIIKKI